MSAVTPDDRHPFAAQPGSNICVCGMPMDDPWHPSTRSQLDTMRAELRLLAKSAYCVNEKRTPNYDRKWYLFVRFADGASDTFVGTDDNSGLIDVYKRAVQAARKRGGTP